MTDQYACTCTRAYNSQVIAVHHFDCPVHGNPEYRRTPPAQTVTIPAPVVNHKGPSDTDASMVRGAADRLAAGYSVGGSNVTHTVVTVLRDVADNLEGRPAGERSGQPVPTPTISGDELLAMTYLERQSLPARHHTPHFYDLGSPAGWICTVCWDDGEVNAWPCAPAIAGGVELADALGLGYSR